MSIILDSRKSDLEIGKGFVSLGLNNDSIKIYNDGLGAWRMKDGNEGESHCSREGFIMSLVESLEASNLRLWSSS